MCWTTAFWPIPTRRAAQTVGLCQKALDRTIPDPQDRLDALISLGVAQRALGRPDHSIATLQKAAALDPANARAMASIQTWIAAQGK